MFSEKRSHFLPNENVFSWAAWPGATGGVLWVAQRKQLLNNVSPGVAQRPLDAEIMVLPEEMMRAGRYHWLLFPCSSLETGFIVRRTRETSHRCKPWCYFLHYCNEHLILFLKEASSSPSKMDHQRHCSVFRPMDDGDPGPMTKWRWSRMSLASPQCFSGNNVDVAGWELFDDTCRKRYSLMLENNRARWFPLNRRIHIFVFCPSLKPVLLIFCSVKGTLWYFCLRIILTK